MSGEQGHYEVALTKGGSLAAPLRRTFPFGQWAEIGFWLDQVGADKGDELTVRFRPLVTAEARWLAILEADIGELELGVRAYNVLKRRGVDTCAQVLNLDLGELAAWDAVHEDDPPSRIGRRAREEIREAQVGLQSLRLQLQAEIEAEQAGVELEQPFACSPDESAGLRERS